MNDQADAAVVAEADLYLGSRHRLTVQKELARRGSEVLLIAFGLCLGGTFQYPSHRMANIIGTLVCAAAVLTLSRFAWRAKKVLETPEQTSLVAQQRAEIVSLREDGHGRAALESAHATVESQGIEFEQRVPELLNGVKRKTVNVSTAIDYIIGQPKLIVTDLIERLVKDKGAMFGYKTDETYCFDFYEYDVDRLVYVCRVRRDALSRSPEQARCWAINQGYIGRAIHAGQAICDSDPFALHKAPDQLRSYDRERYRSIIAAPIRDADCLPDVAYGALCLTSDNPHTLVRGALATAVGNRTYPLAQIFNVRNRALATLKSGKAPRHKV